MNSAKPSLLLIPSPLILPRTYLPLAKELSDAFEVEILKLPGTGKLKGTSLRINDDEYAYYLAGQVRGKNIFILGHSNSGTIAAKYITKFRLNVKGVILADTTGMTKKSYLKTIPKRAIDGLLELRFSIKAFSHLLVNAFLHPINFFYQIHISLKNEVKSTFAEIRVPTLVLWGKKDHSMPLAEGLALHHQIPGSSLYVSQSGSHDWILTNPKEAAGVIKKFAGDFD